MGTISSPIPEVPRVKPFYRDIFIGNDGRMWVMLHGSSEPQPRDAVAGTADGAREARWRERILVAVFEADGRFVGRVRLPETFHPKAFEGDRIWGYMRDSMDVPYLKRLRVQWLGAQD
jgi:hypothetical protein